VLISRGQQHPITWVSWQTGGRVDGSVMEPERTGTQELCSTKKRLAEMIIIIIAPLGILSEDEYEDFECLYKACQSAITDVGLFRDTGVGERGENER